VLWTNASGKRWTPVVLGRPSPRRLEVTLPVEFSPTGEIANKTMEVVKRNLAAREQA
jgi:hypothetical protein